MKIASKIYLILIFVFLYAPLFVMIFFSFNASNSTSHFAGFSMRWYLELLNDGITIDAFKNTMILAVVSSLFATVMGTAAAVGIFSMRNKLAKRSIMTVTNIPMMNPDIVTGISMMLLFVFVGKMLNSTNSLGFFTLLIAP